MRILVLLSVLFLAVSLKAQFKEDLDKKIDIRSNMTNNQPSQFFLDFIDISKFDMKHTFSLSYSAMGKHGMSLGVYTNSISYQFNENLDFKIDASLVNSPYNTFGEEFTNQLNGLYISRAELNFRPAENLEIKLQYLNSPTGYNPFYGYYNPYW